MTIEEAIDHCEKRACYCDACGMEHLQLAEWLMELQVLRKAMDGEGQ
jgi:hypothetical protein